MFAEWVTEGAAFGIKAFIALAVFIAFGAGFIGLLGLGAKLMGGNDGEKNRKRDSY